MTALLTAEARVGARRIHQSHDRETEFLGELHLEQRLAVTLGVGATEVGSDLLGDRLSLVVPDEHALHRTDSRETRDDRGIVAECAIAVELAEVAANHRHVVDGLRTKRMPGDTHRLPRLEVFVNLLEQALAGRVELRELAGVAVRVWALLDRVDLTLNLKNRILEVELVKRAVAGSGHRSEV